MNILTLFDIYQYIEQDIKELEFNREGKMFGIAVYKDLKALKWQRLNAIKYKISHKIRVKMGDKNSMEYNVCLFCGMPGGKYHKCVVDYKEHRKLLRQLIDKGL